jgi:hypothetical protein
MTRPIIVQEDAWLEPYSEIIRLRYEAALKRKEELFTKSGQLLKRTTLSDISQIQVRWIPMTIVYKDMLKQGDGTEFKIISVKFNQDIPEYIFTKAALKK